MREVCRAGCDCGLGESSGLVSKPISVSQTVFIAREMMFDPNCCGVGLGSVWAPVKCSGESLKLKEMPFSPQSEEKRTTAVSVWMNLQRLNLFLSKTNFLLFFCLYDDPKINSCRNGGFM